MKSASASSGAKALPVWVQMQASATMQYWEITWTELKQGQLIAAVHHAIASGPVIPDFRDGCAILTR